MAEFSKLLEATTKLTDAEMASVLIICKEDKFFIALYPKFSDRVLGVIKYLHQTNN